jgi:cell division protein FtsQ
MWDDAKALSGLAATLGAMALAALAVALVVWLAHQPAFAIREVVVVTPLARASAPHLEAAIRDEIRGTFFTLDLERARSALRAVPWVRSVAIRRQWPHRLEIAIEEHEPLARLSDVALVNTLGEAFEATYAADLPRFSGPAAYTAEMTRRYRAWSVMLAPLALDVAEVGMSARGGWRLRAADDAGPITLDVGRDDTGERLARFLDVYRKTIGVLARTGTHVDHVDLRYRNGFAARVPGFREKPAKRG